MGNPAPKELALRTATTPHMRLGCSLTFLAVASLLSGCNASALSNPATPGANRNAQAPARTNNQRSWMDPRAKKGALLYISDPGANMVDVFTYPDGTRAGTLTGFNQPLGLCVDASNNVYVSNSGGSNVLEYAHGGTSPRSIIDDPGQQPYDCAANPMLGNLTGEFAIVNVATTSGDKGSVTIFGGKNPGTLKMNMFSSVLFSDYQPHSNSASLWVDGWNSQNAFQMAVFSPHRIKFRPVSLPRTIGAPGAVHWDGQTLAIGDQDGPNNTTLVDRFSIRNGDVTYVGSTPLSSPVEQFTTAGSTLIGPDTIHGTVGFWNYPAGGSPTKTLTGFVTPFGAAISNP